jgi:seryl-tRNA synthetase
MIDLKDLRANPKAYKDSAHKRGITVDIDQILKLDEARLKLLPDVEQLRGKLKLEGRPSQQQLKEMREYKADLEKLEAKLKVAETKLDEQLWRVPNLLATSTPDGGEEANRQERTWGVAGQPDFEVKDHLTLATERGWLDFERGAKVAGHKFYYMMGSLVKLELAITRLVMDLLEEGGFTPMLVPNMVSERISAGTGYMPRGDEQQIYKIEGADLNLIATAEIPLAGFHADEIIDRAILPIAYAGLSPAYRMEGGAYGKYSRGLYRVHQLNKIEMFIFCAPEDSEQWHSRLVELEEEICQQLEIPYRVVRIAAGDLGAAAYKKFDIEYWSPAEQMYRELMSCSNCTDFQARRLNIKTRNAAGKTEYVHTLNGTGVAFSRTPIAILENHQQVDGSVKLPKVLHNYYGGTTL